MKDQKDIQKTSFNSYSPSSFSGVNSLLNKPAYDFANKKTEKLVTALYMVTDCMEAEGALKDKLRLLGVELLSHIYELNIPTRQDQGGKRASLTYVYEILSFIEIANTMGYISDMNTSILKKEFSQLIEELNSHLSKEKTFPFNLDLDTKMFEVSQDIPKTEALSFNGNSIKRTNNVSFIKNRTNNNVLYKPLTSIDYKKVKSERSEKIISIIKDMSIKEAGKIEASIKDISLVFPDCSEKTIQRELNDLIEKGQIKKTGDKRWSRYSVIVTS